MFVLELRLRVVAQYFAYGSPIVPALFVEKLSFPYCLSTWDANQLTTNLRVYSWTFSSAPLMQAFLLMPIPHTLDCCSFMLSLDIRKSEPSNFFHFSHCLGCARSSAFPYTFYYQFVHFYQRTKPTGILTDYIEHGKNY